MQALFFVIALLNVCFAKQNTDIPGYVHNIQLNCSEHPGEGELKLSIDFTNVPPHLTTFKILTRTQSELFHNSFEGTFLRDNPLDLRFFSKTFPVPIGVQLYTKTGLCKQIIILHGSKKLIGKDRCWIEVDLRNVCADKSNVTPKSNTTHTQAQTRTRKRKERKSKHFNEHENKTKKVQSLTLNNTPVPALSQGQKSKEMVVTNATENTKVSAENANNGTTITIGTLSGVALIVMVVSIARFYRNKYKAREFEGSPTTDPYEPFYVNLLFRKECERETEELEQKKYDEINYQEVGTNIAKSTPQNR